MSDLGQTKTLGPVWAPTGAAQAGVFAGLSWSAAISRSVFVCLVLGVLIIGALCTRNAVLWIDKPFAGFLVNERMVVGNVGRYHWSGTTAGLKYPDKILAANGVPLSSRKDIDTVVNATPLGERITYTVEKNGALVEVAVATRRFTFTDFLMTIGLPFLSGVIYLIIGSIVFILKPDTLVSRVFFFACWLLSIYTITSFDTQSTHWGFMRLYLGVLAIFPATFVHLSLLFPEKKKFLDTHPTLQVLPYMCSLALLIPLELLYPHPSFLPIYRVVLLYLVVSAVVIVGSTLHAYATTSSVVTKQRARVILLGASLAFPLPLGAHYLSLFGGAAANFTIEINFLVIPVLAFPASVAYAMVKHNLFDIDTFVRRTCGYILSTMAIVGAYFAIVLALNALAHSADAARSSFFSLAFAFGVILLFEPLHRRVQRVVDRAFYRQTYDYRATIRDVSRAMTSILDAALIHQTLVGTMTKEMFLENGLLLLPDLTQQYYQVRTVEGGDGHGLQAFRLEATHPAVRIVQERNDALLRYDFDLRPSYAPYRDVLQSTFDTLGSELLLPMTYNEEMGGIISLGRKKSGHMFTLEDLDLLKTLTSQAAIALENARLVKEHVEKTRLEEELKLAHDIQASMLPKQAPTLSGMTIAATSIPAREVGGDFYDFLDLPGGGKGEQLGIVVGDVSGKAISGALVMAASRSIFRVLSETQTSVEEILRIGNQRLQRDIQKGMFVALVYAVVDTHRRQLILSNAGLPHPIYRAGNRKAPTYIETNGNRFPLGIVKNSTYQTIRIDLAPGDTVVLYSDGVVEAMNEQRELYGFERLLVAVEEHGDLPADALMERLRADVARHAGGAEQHDDLTIVVLKVDSAPSTEARFN
jgi:serine phosphatase RsbU (regulator of sigma subunit)